MQRVKIASSFSLCKICSTLIFKLVYVVLHMAVKCFKKKRNSNGHKTGPILRGTRDLASSKQFLCCIKATSDPCRAPSVFTNFSLFRFVNQNQFSLIVSVEDC